MTGDPKKRIYCIPGQGTNHSLFSRLELPGCELLPIAWVAPEKHESMQSYAKKLLRQIDTSQPFYLMGVSLGGMLSVEITEFLNPTKTIIISSAKNRSELPWTIKMLKYIPIYRLFQNNFFTWLAIRNRWMFGVKKEDAALFESLMQNLPKKYFDYTSHCVVNWCRKESNPKIVHIHGNKDKVIPIRKNMHAIKIEGGAHLMVLNQHKEISEIILQNLG